MILGICTGQVYITLNVFIIVLEACLKLRADLTNIPTSGRASQLSRAPKTVLLSKVTLTLGINNFLVVWIENLSNFHISAMSNNRITSIKYKVERDERNLPYIELGRWLCSHFQLETPLNFHKPITRKLYNVE